MRSLLNRISYRMDALILKLYFVLLIKLSLTRKKKRILVIKNDSIGDYIIFRNFLYEIKKAPRYRDYELYLLTTCKLAPIVKELEGDYIKSILLFDPGSFTSVWLRIRFYNLLRSYRFGYMLHPTYSPDSTTQNLVKYIDSRYKIGFDGDLSNQTAAEKVYYERYYTELIPIRNVYSHEFLKDVDFFTAFLKQQVSISKPALPKDQRRPVEKKILICPGAQHAFRIWSLSNFAGLITRLHKEFPQYNFTLVTGPGEETLFSGIAEQLTVKPLHFRISSFLELVSLISGAGLVVCNDSSPAHIAVACDTNSVCISNGNHLGRFVPYPKEMKVKQKVILPATLLRELERDRNDHRYYFGSTLNINEITVDEVFEACVSYLKEIA